MNMPNSPAATVVDRAERQRFELQVDDSVAFIAYTKSGDRISFDHTEVPPELGGRGVGSRLAQGALELARTQALKVIPRCRFIAEYIQRHPEFAGLVVRD